MKSEPAVARSQAQELIEFLHAMKLDGVPASAVEHAKWCLLDSLGCGLFGSRQLWSKIMAEEMFAEGSRGNSTVFGYRKPLAGPAAALCNGTASHGFELDDLLDEAIVHPGAIVVPAALAAAEAVDASGSRLVLGVIAGYEVMDRVGRAIGFDSAHRGFHKTSVVGPLGAVVAAGVVMGLTSAQMHAATGLACSTASGIKSFAAGTGGGMMKRMHAGRPAEAGVRMAQLAGRDFTGPPTAIDGRFGMLEVFGGPTANPEPLTAGLGRHWAVEHVYVKVYPCCSWIQASVQQLAALRGPQPLDVREIAGVRIGTNSYAKRINGQPAPPDTMGAQYSIPYCAALALTGDPADPAMYGPDRLDDRARRELAARVELVIDPEMEAVYPKHYGARVELRLANGECRESFVMDPHGMPGDPCTERERLEKFARLASAVMPPARAQDISAWIRGCDQAASVRDLTGWLRG
jgi:2-methylcitrate dehydratase PrpD